MAMAHAAVVRGRADDQTPDARAVQRQTARLTGRARRARAAGGGMAGGGGGVGRVIH